ncbi:MAG: ATP-binding protein [Burkholderiaceae bacterium]|nr:ATP-binding protein [Burkholderiaceae bacterium]
MNATTPSQPFFNRLYVRIWLAVVFAVAVLIFLVGWAWRLSAERQSAEIGLTPVVREVVVRNSAGETIGAATAQARVPGQGLEFSVQLKQPLAVGETLNLQIPRGRRMNPETGEMEPFRPPPPPGMHFNRDGRPSERPDRMGRPDRMDRPDRPYGPGGPADKTWFKPPFGFVWMLVLVGLAVALGTYPVIRRLTKRLESLQRGVEQWGQGDLSTRVAVTGSDEVAFLAERFNTAAARIEALVGSHKSLLANASHELRTPLTRIRMGLELMDGAKSSADLERLKNEIYLNINELDQLIAEILLASRLDSVQADVGMFESVDLIGMAAEECAHTGAQLEVQEAVSALVVPGVPKLLRRLMRNLLENANRYARSSTQAVELSLQIAGSAGQASAVIRVTDHGPGVPPELRERIFEPFFRAPGASERDGGVGLGLALVKSIAQRHGGTVRCEAGPGGKGASFVVTLPIKAVN